MIVEGLDKGLFVLYKESMEVEIAASLEDRSGPGIAAAIGSLITGGQINHGDKLPTVRSLAAHLGVSANTVSDAWRILQTHGAITTDRRRGTTVRSTRVGLAGRYWRVPVEPGTIELDLSTGTPDPTLLPPLGPVLHQLHTDVGVTSYLDPPVLVELEAELRRSWPFVPAALTVVDGAHDALDRAVTEIVNLGDHVIVEDPTFPPLLDMLDLAGARITGVPVDSGGPSLEHMAAAMRADPVAVIIQPRTHNPTGVHLCAERSQAVARLVDGTRTLVIEDDHSAGATNVAIHSVGEHAPDNTVHIRSFSKSYGPDLRIAAISGPKPVIAAIARRRQLGPSWTSRLIQQILLTMLLDPATEDLIALAETEYSRRRGELCLLLAERGITVEPGAGLNLWIPVSDELRAVVTLAAHGIGVAPGAPFRASSSPEQHIRLSIGTLRGDSERVADIVLLAATQ